MPLLFFMEKMGPAETELEVIRYPRVDSTNSMAFDLGCQGAEHGTVVLAEEQTGGRGRQSRDFSSPPGGLYMSVIMRPLVPIEYLSYITLAAGVASAAAIEMASGISIQLKWPNDLYANGKKLGGILTEAAPYSHESSSVQFVVVGIGLNINTNTNSFPDSLHDLATSLYCLTNQKYDIDALLHDLVAKLFDEVFLLQDSPEKVMAHWRERDYLQGKKLSWQDPQGRIVHGTGNGLLTDGRYRLTTSGGDDYPVLAGDIIITDINGQHLK